MKRICLIFISLMLISNSCPPPDPLPSNNFITVDGTRINYLIDGQGIPCIVIHTARTFPKVFNSEELRKHFEFIFMDHRPFVQPDEPYDKFKFDLDAAIDDIEKIREKLGFAKIAVLGHSYPALLPLAYAQKYPENVSHAILVDITPVYNEYSKNAALDYWDSTASDERKQILENNHLNWTDLVLSDVPSEWRNYVRNAPKFFYDSTYNPSWIFEGYSVDQSRTKHFTDYKLSKYDFTQGDEIFTPVFLALGKFSFVCPYYLWDDYKDELPNLSYNLFTKSGHFPFLEEQELFNTKLIEWINTQ